VKVNRNSTQEVTLNLLNFSIVYLNWKENAWQETPELVLWSLRVSHFSVEDDCKFTVFVVVVKSDFGTSNSLVYVSSPANTAFLSKFSVVCGHCK